MKKKLTKLRLLVGAILLTIIIGSSLNVAFANQDISSMLISWFEKNRVESIERIESAIYSEKEKQIERLKEELRLEIEQAKEQLELFTEAEKQKRVQELQNYADSLISNLDVDMSNDKDAILEQYELIMQEAIEKMNMVEMDTSQSTISSGTGDESGDSQE
ncbi:hypothetical protein [Ornithinibacillus halotolerans]|uniref:Uncharacterized protein n=1 Tax=Ornithinibacillus halotolerans TaxID=1274357 RepID=A0A916S114_9BACI|nr:hypothetical protein [Ornithinibacillus halotolerans]GGA79281.1 hypothetical protein GCM10008025_23370 [Ornithinibacillus halotolerans]